MANSIATGLASDSIARETLRILAEDLSWFRGISFRPSPTQVKKGQQVVYTIPTSTSAQDFGASGYANADQTLSTHGVHMDQHKFVAYGITDGERDSSLVNLVEGFAEANAHALGSAITDKLLYQATLFLGYSGTSFDVPASQKLTISEANFGLDDLITVGKVMDEAGIPKLGRWGILHPSYHAKLEQDVVQIGNSSVDVSGTLANGRLGKVRGFDLFSCSNQHLQKPVFAGGWRALFGVGDSLVVGTAVPGMPEVSDGGEISYVTEPNTGLTVQKRVNYDYANASLNTVLTLYFGANVLNQNTLVSIADS